MIVAAGLVRVRVYASTIYFLHLFFPALPPLPLITRLVPDVLPSCVVCLAAVDPCENFRHSV